MSALEIYVLATPLIVIAVAVIVILLTRWQDAREDRRRGTR